MHKLKLWIGAGFGAGFVPYMPGTIGSFVALIPIYFILLSNFPIIYLFVFILACSILNMWVSKACEAAWGQDPPKMVIDEWAGQAVTFLTISTVTTTLSITSILFFGFAFFRIFDILKPLGIKKLQNLGGGLGILIDDLLAGVYSLISLHLFLFFLG